MSETTSDVIRDGSGPRCACGEQFEGYTITETVVGVMPASAAGEDAEGLPPEELVRVVERRLDYSVAQAAYAAHVGEGRDLCPAVARAEADEHDRAINAAAAAQAAVAAADQERADVVRARQVQEALLALLAPKTGATA